MVAFNFRRGAVQGGRVGRNGAEGPVTGLLALAAATNLEEAEGSSLLDSVQLLVQAGTWTDRLPALVPPPPPPLLVLKLSARTSVADPDHFGTVPKDPNPTFILVPLKIRILPYILSFHHCRCRFRTVRGRICKELQDFSSKTLKCSTVFGLIRIRFQIQNGSDLEPEKW